jgi:hypothetical protein
MQGRPFAIAVPMLLLAAALTLAHPAASAPCDDLDPCTYDVVRPDGSCDHQAYACDEHGDCDHPVGDDSENDRCEASRVNKAFWPFSKKTSGDLDKMFRDVSDIRGMVEGLNASKTWMIVVLVVISVVVSLDIAIVCILDVPTIIRGVTNHAHSPRQPLAEDDKRLSADQVPPGPTAAAPSTSGSTESSTRTSDRQPASCASPSGGIKRSSH